MEAAHLLLVEIFELEHQRADVVTQRLDRLKKPGHQAGGEEVGIGDEGRALIFAVVVGQGDAVRHLDAENEAGRHRGGVLAHDVGTGQNRNVLVEQRPEPLVDFDGGVAAAVLRQ